MERFGEGGIEGGIQEDEIMSEARRMLADLPDNLTFERKMALLEQRLIEAGVELDPRKKNLLRAILQTFGRIKLTIPL